MLSVVAGVKELVH